MANKLCNYCNQYPVIKGKEKCKSCFGVLTKIKKEIKNVCEGCPSFKSDPYKMKKLCCGTNLTDGVFQLNVDFRKPKYNS